MGRIPRALRALPLQLISPLPILCTLLAIGVADLLWRLAGGRRRPRDTRPRTDAVSVVIPSWNGKDLLETHLPSVAAAVARHPASEILVVDNGSSDGTAEFLGRHFPQVRVLALPGNLGFGGGSNAGFRAARHDIAVLLNNDMHVEPGFLEPLLDGFTDEKVFAVSCQIFFRDPGKLREETGLTQGWWENGGLRVRHRADERVDELYPCFYAGGGSSAFDRRKLLELGAFDEIFAPFYLEDTDLGYRAWKRGWKVLYQPASVVFHEHRGTIGRRFRPEEIEAVLQRNYLLWAWKNIHEWPRLLSHFFFAGAGTLAFLPFGSMGKLEALWRAFGRLPRILRSRWRARSLAVVDDSEAFCRPMGAWFRDRFLELPAETGRPAVLFVSPYPICPPVHGGGVFMFQTLVELAPLCELHLVVLLDTPAEEPAHEDLIRRCASAEFLPRLEGRPRQLGSIVPFAVREFASEELEWVIHRQCYLRRIDVVQLEYFPLAQYHGRFRQLVTILFEHDIYFQSIARSVPHMRGLLKRLKASFEYLRALRWELRLLPAFDRIQVCSRENGEYLAGFLPALADRMDSNLRAGIDPGRYVFRPEGREPHTMLFLGSFRHAPNQDALRWFVERVAPLVFARRPAARLVVVGSDPPPPHSMPDSGGAIELRGFVEDVREPLARYGLFVCPILSGSGVRVKLLEAFAAGMPVVSTTLGAEGLTLADGEVCALADTPEAFAGKILDLFDRPEEAAAMARRARSMVETERNVRVITRQLVESYREAVRRKRLTTA